MSSRFISFAILALASALPLTATAQAGAATSTARQTTPGTAPTGTAPVREPESRASRILGMDVVNREGEKVGDVEDIVVDRNGSVSYAIVSTGAYLGVGTRLHAVPWAALQPHPVADHLVLDVDRDRLARAPGFDPNDKPDLNDRQWSAENRKHFRSAVPRARAAPAAAARASDGTVPAAGPVRGRGSAADPTPVNPVSTGQQARTQ